MYYSAREYTPLESAGRKLLWVELPVFTLFFTLLVKLVIYLFI